MFDIILDSTYSNPMKRIPALIILVLFGFSLTSCSTNSQGGNWYDGIDLSGLLSKDATTAEIGEALKEALRIGSENVVNNLGGKDGFNADPTIHIALPKELDKVKEMLNKVGLSGIVDDFELRLNRAAEVATPKAKALFLQAIGEMTFDDIKGIYQGPEDSATQYFRSKMSDSLRKEMRPIIDNSLSQVGAVKAFNNVMGKYQAIPFAPKIEADLTGHVVEKAMDGIFYYVAQEEAAIRKDPVKQTTALLRKVFGTK